MYVRSTCEVCTFHLVLLAMADSSERVSRLLVAKTSAASRPRCNRTAAQATLSRIPLDR